MLSVEKIDEIISEDKPNQIPKFKINQSRLEKVLPTNIKTNQAMNFSSLDKKFVLCGKPQSPQKTIIIFVVIYRDKLYYCKK